MSTALALGAVTAVLRNILDNGLIDAGPALGAPVKVTAIAPDLIDLTDHTAPPQLNLFLFRVTPNSGWRNADLPARNGGGDRLTNPPLAVDLHYLLTAYGKTDLQADILLGYAMYLMHQRPWLDRATIRSALSLTPLDPTILPDAFRDPPAAGLADQLDAVKVTWEPMDTEELSRLWSAIQVHYRPSACYQASVVLMQATRPAQQPLPVLRRGPVDPLTNKDTGVAVVASLVPPYPAIDRIDGPSTHDTPQLGDTVTLRGRFLAGTGVTVTFAHRLLAVPHEVAIGTTTNADHIDVPLPPPPGADAAWPAGVWAVSATLLPAGDTDVRQTNTVAMLLAPTPTLPPASVGRDATTHRVTVTIGVSPQARVEQEASLTLDTATATATSRTVPASQLTFEFDPVPAGARWVRLRVDGVDSQLIDRSATPPVFLAGQTVTVPP
jgi:hypothetical protein